MAFNLDQIRSTAARVAASHGLEVVELEFHGGAKHRLLRVFIEKNAEGRARLAAQAAQDEVKLPANVSLDQLAGVTHEDCEQFSQDFGTVIDVEDLIPGSEYLLEVSSPGLDRKLNGMEDYQRFAGGLVKLQTFMPIDGNRHWQGRIVGASDAGIVLDVSEGKKRKSKAKQSKGSQRKEEQGGANSEDAKTRTIPVSNIEKANLVPEI
ncbi:MAG TPA: ribosome maturation factor RimP [Acidobacteriaceae bacterium]|jgi:ribosome maturation factor RimP|nr:ribosome maturation factor RimP [Acidobacteriaceae bacterium]